MANVQASPTAQVLLRWDAGTLLLEGLGTRKSAEDRGAQESHTAELELPPQATWDPRREVARAPAVAYAELIRWLLAHKIAHTDQARAYEELERPALVQKSPFPHQREALERWLGQRSRGVVVLPTGAGKTFVATSAIEAKKRASLVVVPTLDLMNQWYDILRTTFGGEIGLVGGGYHEVLPLTVSTYDSAQLHMDRLGNRFGLVIFDECHHLPSESYSLAARMCLAPFRLGLTATPERSDGRERLYPELIGPLVLRKEITELSGDILATYETVRLEVPLSEEEKRDYEEARGEYLTFLRSSGVRMGEPDGWQRFLMLSTQSEAGRGAFEAYRRQRALALAAPGKLAALERLLHAHRGEQVLVFTEDNATAHAISRRLLLPTITHQTKVKERSAILQAFRKGELFAIVTSKVLNEGVDVPEASVGIILSGSASVREHVQRLGRILRRAEGKRALLYELVSAGTSEERTSEKRRDHVAYR